MINFLVGVGVIAALFASTYGWGSIAARLAYGRSSQPVSFLVALGCAVFVFIGGILNATHSVGPTTMSLLVNGGFALAALSLFSGAGLLAQLKSAARAPTVWIIFALSAYLAFTLVPTTTFNIGDDFHTYLVYPMRMLEAGSGSAGDVELLGAGTLTAQAFFHAVVLRYVPIAFISTFDPVFCFLVAGLLVDAIGRKTGLDWRYRLFPIFCFVVINPQYVNVSSLYSGSMMVLALIYASMLLCESEPDRIGEMAARTLPVALCVSAIAMLKLTFFGFVIAYSLLFGLALLALGWTVRRALTFGAVLFVLAVVFAGPWILVLLGSYFEVFGQVLTRMVDARSVPNTAPVPSVGPSGQTVGPIGLISPERLFWGGSFIGYLFILLLLGFASVTLFIRNRRVDKKNRNPHLVLGMVVFLAAVFATVLLSYQARPDLTVRYSAPLLIALFPLLVALAGSLFPTTVAADTILRLPAVAGALILGQVLVIGQFADVFAKNLANSYLQRSLLAYPITNLRDFEYTGSALRQDARKAIREAQAKIPEGETVFAWMDMPFHLDFARNRLLVLDKPGFNTLAKRMDFDTAFSSFEVYLRSQGIRYIIWSKDSYGMSTKQRLQRQLNTYLRVSAERQLRLMETLDYMARNHTKLFDDGGLVVIDISD